jgi:small-conductance mechanosensitive channel
MSLAELLSLAGPYAPWIWTLLIVVAGAVVYAILGWLIRRVREPKTRVALSRVAGAVVAFFVLIAILSVWVNSAAVILVVAGLVSAGIAFSLQGPLTSLVAWLAILTLKPFEIGDRVRSGSVAGDVVAYNPLFFSVLEIGEWSGGDLYTGRLVEVPNNQIMTQPLVNYTRNFGFLWDTVVVGVYYEADWARARTLALAVADHVSAPLLAAARRDLAQFRERNFMPRGQLEPQVFLSMESTTINVTVRYVTDVWKRSASHSAVVEGILREFSAAGIDIAYPSVVLRPSDAGPPPGAAGLATPPAGAHGPSAGGPR